jgi:general secretion pathway protein M
MAFLINKRWQCPVLWSSLLFLVIALALLIGLPWWQEATALEAQWQRDSEQLVRYQRLVATLPVLRQELEQVKNRDDTKAFYFAADTPALAGAQLQTEVQDIIRAAGARPVSTQILPIDTKDHPPRIRIRTQLQGPTHSLLKVLYRIESARPFLFIEQMSIRSAAQDIAQRPTRRTRNSNSTPPKERDELTVRLDIFAYALEVDNS